MADWQSVTAPVASAASHSNSSSSLLMSHFEIRTLLSALHRESIHGPQRTHGKKSTPYHESTHLLQAVYEKAEQAVRRYLKKFFEEKKQMEWCNVFGLVWSGLVWWFRSVVPWMRTFEKKNPTDSSKVLRKGILMQPCSETLFLKGSTCGIP